MDDTWHIPSPASSFKHRSTSPGSGALAARSLNVAHRSVYCQLTEQGVRFSLHVCSEAVCGIPADGMDGIDVTAGDVSPWHAAKSAQPPLSDVCDAAAGGDRPADYSPMSDDAGGSISPQSDGGGGFFAAPPPLLYEPAVMVPWGQGALHSRPSTSEHRNICCVSNSLAQQCKRHRVEAHSIKRPQRGMSNDLSHIGCFVLPVIFSHSMSAVVQAQTQQQQQQPT